MDFVRLGLIEDANYYPDALIEGYVSLVWTERFSTFGEFQLKTYDIENTMALLPEDTLVSHLETRYVMMVETHSIKTEGEGSDAIEVLTVSGRGAGLILENRFLEGKYQKKRKLRRQYTATGAAGVLIWNAINNGSGKDVTRGDDDPETPIDANDYDWTTKDQLPNVCVTDSVADDGESRWWRVEEGMLMPQLQRIMDNQDLGLRCLRPGEDNIATIITVDTALETRGKVNRNDPEDDISKLRFDIYSGIDRSEDVQFNDLLGHLGNPEYLFTSLGYKTEMEMRSGEVSIHDLYRPGDEGLTGWKRRTADFDAGTPELPPEPEEPKKPKSDASKATKKAYDHDYDVWVEKHAKWKNKRNAIVADFKEEQVKAATKQLKKSKRIKMFIGDLTAGSPYVYGVDYFLGDTIRLNGRYGVSNKMVVAEFIRTEDANGDRSLPGLIAPD